MEFFAAELAIRPNGHTGNHITLADKIRCSTRPVRWFGEFVPHSNVRTDSYNEHAPARLCHAVVLSVQSRPVNAVACQSIAIHLIQEQPPVLSVGHTIDILDYKRPRSNFPKHTVKLSIQEIDWSLRIANSALTIALARIASHEEIGFREVAKRRYVA
jgi:hypothetical protein